MATTLATILVTLALLFGAGGATVYAAQDSLPDEALYPVKTTAEEVRLRLTTEPAARFDLALGYAGRRVEEVAALVSIGEKIPEALIARLQADMDIALLAAAAMEETNLVASLEKLQEHVQKHDRVLLKIQAKIPDQADPQLAQIRSMLQHRLQVAQGGIATPQNFRYTVQEQIRNQTGEAGGPAVTTEPGQPGAGQGDGQGQGPVGPAETAEPGDGNSYGPGPGQPPAETGVPNDGPGYGPGPDGSGDTPPEPGDGTGNRPEETPGPGEGGYGPGPGGIPPTTPAPALGPSYGPGPTNPDPGADTGGNGQQGKN